MDSSQDIIEVVIAGAGGAGLTLGSVLKSLNVNFTIIEPLKSITLFSKASGLHSNSLRLLSQIGLTLEMEKSSNELNASNVILNGKCTNRIEFQQGHYFFEKNISISQHKLESILENKIGSNIQRGHRVDGYIEKDEYIECTVKNTETEVIKKIQCRYLIACDGARSSIRKALNYTFDGFTYETESFTFDAKILSELNHQEGYFFETNNERLILMPLEQGQMFKIYGRILADFSDDVRQDLVEIVKRRSGLDLDINSIQGFLRYRNSSRLANKFTSGRVVLIGDAAHLFEPYGGYGLNTAIEDAFTLAWRLKLALAFPTKSKLW